jgi:hypothetical protein
MVDRLTKFGYVPKDKALVASDIQQNKQNLLEEIKHAQLDWLYAQSQYDEAVDFEQIEYAVYYLMATEKKYGLLINQAKKLFAQSRK